MEWNPFHHLSKTRKFPLARLIYSPFWQRVKDTFKVFYGKWMRNSFAPRLKMGLLDYLFPWQKGLAYFFSQFGTRNGFAFGLCALLFIPWLIIEGVRLAVAALLTLVISVLILPIVHAYYAYKKEKLVKRIENLSVKRCMDEKTYRIKTVKSRLEVAQAAEAEVKRLQATGLLGVLLPKEVLGEENWAKANQLQDNRYRKLDTPEVETREEYLGEEQNLKRCAPDLYEGYGRDAKHGLGAIAVPLRKDEQGKYEKIPMGRDNVRLYVMEQDNESERQSIIQNSKQSLYDERVYRKNIIMLVGSGSNRTAYFYHRREVRANKTGEIGNKELEGLLHKGRTIEEAQYLYNEEQVDSSFKNTIIKEGQGMVDIALSAEEQNYLAYEQGWVDKSPQDAMYRKIVKKVEIQANHPFCSPTRCDRIPDALGLYEFQEQIPAMGSDWAPTENDPKPLAIIPVEPKNYPGIRAILKLNSFWTTEKLENHPLLDIDQFVEEISEESVVPLI